MRAQVLFLTILLGCASMPPKLAPLFAAPAIQPRADLRSPLLFDDGTPVRTAADWERRRKEIRTAWDRILGPWPPLVMKPEVRDLGTQQQDGYTRQTIDFQIAPDRFVRAYLLRPDKAGRKPAAVTLYYDPETLAGIGGKGPLRDFGVVLVRSGFVTLNIGIQPTPKDALIYYPSPEGAQLQPLSYLAYVAANAYNLLATLPEVDPDRVGVVGHSYGGKWALFAGALYDKFAAVAVSDPGVVFDETRPAVNYWDPWYLGYEPGTAGQGFQGVKRLGAYKRLRDGGHDLHELHALIAPRPFFVSGGAADIPEQWSALAHLVAVDRLLGHQNRVGMANRPKHAPTPEAVEQIRLFFEHFLGH